MEAVRISTWGRTINYRSFNLQNMGKEKNAKKTNTDPILTLTLNPQSKRSKAKGTKQVTRVVFWVSTSRSRWSRLSRVETYQRLVSVSSREKLSTSWSRLGLERQTSLSPRPFTSRAQDQFSATSCRLWYQCTECINSFMT